MPEAPELRSVELDGYESYRRYRAAHEAEYRDRRAVERALAYSGQPFRIPGWCHLCADAVDFSVRYEHAWAPDGPIVMPNFREEMNCSRCGFNNRMRAAIHVLDSRVEPAADIYVTEQITPLFAVLKDRRPSVIGSEYLGSALEFGATTLDGIRNESVTRLTFDDNRFDAIMCFDVLEHVPNFRAAFSSCLRCLKPGGTLFFTVPFTGRNETIVQARVEADGSVTHLTPAEYHGDPLTSDGCLCFYHFGWDLFGILREIGYDSTVAILYYSVALGYMGNCEQVILAASKPRRRLETVWRSITNLRRRPRLSTPPAAARADRPSPNSSRDD